MAIRVALHHETTYRYNRDVNLGPQVVRLRPAPHCRTPIHGYSLRVEPRKHFCNWQQDPQSNYNARLVFPEKVREFKVSVEVVAELVTINPFDFFLEPEAENWPFNYDASLEHELRPYLLCEDATPLFAKYLAGVDRRSRRTVDFIVELNRQVQQDIGYIIRLEPGVQSCDETLEKRSGSCRDSAWLIVQLFRRLGLAARFVSGYLIQLAPDVKPIDGPAGPAADFTDLHAWAEVYLPGAGWVGVDPTSGLLAGEGHIPLACTPDPQGAAPITGLVDECEVEFGFEMRVERVAEKPRSTRPYTDEQWAAIEALGHRVDEALRAGDVRLTMGGEPTFVSIDDMDGAEWNTAAMGPTKRGLAGELIRRLRAKFAPGGLLHYGQGKWYPGESLPRWALTCLWRRDGQPVWHDVALAGDDRHPTNPTAEDARSFVRLLAENLGVDADHAVPGYEDAWYYLWRERRLPLNVDPLKSELSDPEERERLARVFRRGLGATIGYALPIQRRFDATGAAWQSGAWFFRQEHMFLIPGDSPMGFRLPLDSLPWASDDDYQPIGELDPTAPRGPLAPADQMRRRESPAEQRLARGAVSPQRLLREEAVRQLHPHRSAPWVVRTALCVEPRDGHLHVFMPPVYTVDDYLELISAVEATARALAQPVMVEGYLPPHDHRINTIKVTPDPGVIEVNIHPAHSWDEMVTTTTVLYEEARQSRLGTEKFMLDGRHSGTGGGNHIVIGGATPTDSPILRRPDLLRSLLNFWNNHPSLSYLFSSLFVGPTSQHPRVDEARHDSLYELEVAFRQIPDRAQVPPWLVDRLFRNLLVDSTGNTHRVEFCIDKLYSPDGGAGRLGLVEMRAFEMPPHARMSLAQQLLLRALIARFWNEPYAQPLVKWGTQLHDRFMLPHFVRQDFEDVIEDLNNAGFPFRPEWFEAHYEFRFPLVGVFNARDVVIELRTAIEPWHVLGEQQTSGGTSRYVDSSLERLQVKTSGLIDSRHVVACNGRRVPLHPTGRNGEFVAGVRFRAWQPPECLHPTIGVHSPLTFDLVDTWSQRSVGGCTYHVVHPGGRSYDSFPVNALEAEARRFSRFQPFGMVQGRMVRIDETSPAEFPFTLDLRR